MDKLKMHSPDITQQNIDKLLELFPNCKTEKQDANGELRTGIDFDLLKQELSKNIVEGPQERYQLNWPGKKEALLTANAPIAKTLRPCREESVDFDTTENLFIEGDNLDALKLLQETYLGKVKMIYIDPPYNTGNDFIYNDDFSETPEEYLLGSEQKDEIGNRLIANTESNGRFHSDWLSMILSRLKLARSLLRDDGVIFISIDDHEVGPLRQVCDEIFGLDNFVVSVIWEKLQTRKNSAKYFSESHEYVLCFAKNIEKFQRNLLPRDESKNPYKNPDNDPKGPWKLDRVYANNPYSADYTITSPNGTIFKRPEGKYWRYSQDSINRFINEGRLVWTNPDSYPHYKRYLSEVQDGLVPVSLFDRKFAGDNGLASREQEELLGVAKIMSYPKPVKLLEQLIHIGSSDGDLVLDFFAGSSTTAHAIMKGNVEGCKRKFIMVQLPEACGEKSEGFKAGYNTIADISKERIRRAGIKIKLEIPSAAKLDIGFRVLKVDSTNMNDVYYTPDTVSKGDLFNQVEHIKKDRSSEDLLFQVMLDWGVDLSLTIRKETIEGKEVYFVNDDDLVACFDKGIDEALIKALAAKQPLRVVFRDDGFVSDSVKINVEQIFEQLAPATDIKAI